MDTMEKVIWLLLCLSMFGVGVLIIIGGLNSPLGTVGTFVIVSIGSVFCLVSGCLGSLIFMKA